MRFEQCSLSLNLPESWARFNEGSIPGLIVFWGIRGRLEPHPLNSFAPVLHRQHHFIPFGIGFDDQAVKMYPKLAEMEGQLRTQHFNRLREGTARSISTSSLHLDLINSFLRIAEHTRNICVEMATRGKKEHLIHSQSAGEDAVRYENLAAVQ